MDRFDRVRTDLVRRLVVGAVDGDDGAVEPAAGEFLTGDLNLLRVQAIVQYRVASPGAMVVAALDVEGLLKRLAEAGLSRALARGEIDSVIRGSRQRIGAEMGNDLRAAVERHRLGLEILGVSLTDVRPPAEVAPDFAAAQSAESQRDRRSTEARTQAETTLATAKAAAQARLETARAASHRKVVTSRAEANRFLALLAEARRSRELTVQRIYLDAMTSLLRKVERKIVLPPGDAVDLTVLGIEE
jgi:membrane protease subunit HflK